MSDDTDAVQRQALRDASKSLATRLVIDRIALHDVAVATAWLRGRLICGPFGSQLDRDATRVVLASVSEPRP
jgi:hypothetical protein